MKPFQDLNTREMQKILNQLPEASWWMMKNGGSLGEIESYPTYVLDDYEFRLVECGIRYEWELVL